MNPNSTTTPPIDPLLTSSTSSPQQQNEAILSKRILNDLLTQINPTFKLDNHVSDMFMDLADEFIESSTKFGCELAKHRNANTLLLKDLQLYLESQYKVRVPGFTVNPTPIQDTLDLSSGRRRGNGLGIGHSTRIAAVKKAVFEENLRRDKVKERTKDNA